MKKFLSIVLMVLLVMSPVMAVEAKTTTKATTTTVAKKTTTKATKKTTTKKTTTEEAKEDKNPINIYVFYSSTCPHCQDLHSFLNELKEDKTYGDMFKVVDYEVSQKENSDIVFSVANHFNYKEEDGKSYGGGVPAYVIGNKFMVGYGSTMADEVKAAIKAAYDEQPIDEVAKLISEMSNKKDNNAIGYIVLAVATVIIIAVIYSSSKNKYYDDEEVVEEKPEKVAETKKEESKKTDSKKTSSTTKKKTTKKNTTKKKTTKKKV